MMTSMFYGKHNEKELSISRVWNISVYGSITVCDLFINEVNWSNWIYQINDLLEVSIISIEKKLIWTVYYHLIAMYGKKYTSIPIFFIMLFLEKYLVILKVYRFSLKAIWICNMVL